MMRVNGLALLLGLFSVGGLSAQEEIPAVPADSSQLSSTSAPPPAPSIPTAPGLPGLSTGLPGAGALSGAGGPSGGGIGLSAAGGLPGIDAAPGTNRLSGMNGLPAAGVLPGGGAPGTGLMGGLNPLGGTSPIPGFSPLEMAFPPLMAFRYLNAGTQATAAPDGVSRIIPQSGVFKAYGWLDAGTIYNTSQPASGFNGPYNAVDSTTPVFNQAYLVLEMERPENSDFDIGGRIDVLYGNDFFLAQSIGFETNPDGSRKWNSSEMYGLAIPQAYLEVGGDTLFVQLGHFYTVVGYEGVPSAYNFFYSHAYSYQFAGPFTQWGGLVTWLPADNWEIQGGPVNGWNTLDATTDNVEFLGKAKYTSDAKDWWASFAIITGNMPNNAPIFPGLAPAVGNRTRYSLIVDKKLDENLEYLFHQWFGCQQDGTPTGSTANWYGIDQYLFYTLNDRWKLGGRFEWFRDEEGTRVGLNRSGNPNKPPLPGNYFSFTVGPNYSPSPNLVIRPEVRYDTYNGSALPFDDGQKTQQLMFGVDAIVKF